jgi:hypothetical protein
MEPKTATAVLRGMAKATVSGVPPRGAWPYDLAMARHAEYGQLTALREDTEGTIALAARLEGLAADESDMWQQACEAADVLVAVAETVGTSDGRSNVAARMLAPDLLKAGLDIRLASQRKSPGKMKEATDFGVEAAERLTALPAAKKHGKDGGAEIEWSDFTADFENAWLKALSLKGSIAALSTTPEELQKSALRTVEAEGLAAPKPEKLDVDGEAHARLDSDRKRLRNAAASLRGGDRQAARNSLETAKAAATPAHEAAVAILLKTNVGLSARVVKNRFEAARIEATMAKIVREIGSAEDAALADEAEDALADKRTAAAAQTTDR